MKGDPEFVILKYHAWPDAKFESKLLGAIVKEPLKPTNNYVPDAPLQYNREELFEGSLTDFVLAKSDSDVAEVSAKIKSLASLSVHGAVSDAVNLNGKMIRYKHLQQIDAFWEALVRDKAVEQKVGLWLTPFKPPPCLVVGIMICEDVELSFSGEASREVSGHIELPVGSVTLAAQVPDLTGGAVDPEASARIAHKTVTIFQAKTGQSRIFALEFQKVTTKGVLQKRLALSRDGPQFGAARLFSGDVDPVLDDDEPFTVDGLLREGFTAEEYASMTA